MLTDHLCIGHALLVELAVPERFRPGRFVVLEIVPEDFRVLERRINVWPLARIARHPHKTETRIRVVLTKRRVCSVAKILVLVEFQPCLGAVEARKVPIDQHRHWMTQIQGGTAGSKKRLAAVRPRQHQAVPLNVFGGDHMVGLQIGAEVA